MHSEKVKDIAIIIPAFNESDSINELFNRLKKNIPDQFGLDVSYIFINDGSSDSTHSVIKELIKQNKNTEIILIDHLRNYGKTVALKNGINQAKSNFILMLDADLQDSPDDFAKFWKKINDGPYDMVVGNRSGRYKNNILKKTSSLIINSIVKSISNYTIHDMNCGYKLMTTECAKSLDLKSDYHRYIPFLAIISGYNVSEVEIVQEDRKHGVSKYGKTGLKRLIKSLMDIISISFIYKFRDNPFNLFGRIGILMTLIGTLILAYLGVGWFMGNYIEGRPLFFIGILFVIVGINNISLGLLGELIQINVGNRNNSGAYKSHKVYVAQDNAN